MFIRALVSDLASLCWFCQFLDTYLEGCFFWLRIRSTNAGFFFLNLNW